MLRQPTRLVVLCCLALGGACLGLTALPVVAQTNITAMEYYIDVDPGEGNATNIPAVGGAYGSTQVTGQVTLNTTGFKPGPHQVYIRAKNSSNIWGTYPPQLLYVYEHTSVQRVECYIDWVPDPGNGTALQAVDGVFDSSSEAIKGSIPVSGLSVGSYTLYLRAQNTANIWGPARALQFEVLPAVTVSAAECGFGGATDTNPTMGTYSMQAQDGMFNQTVESVVANGVPAPSQSGTYRVFVRAMNNWNMPGPWTNILFDVWTAAYEAWVTGYGLSGSDKLETADPDHDGILNIVEYAFNMRPDQPDNVVLTPATGTNGLPCWTLSSSNGGRLLTLEYVKRKDDSNLTYNVKFCGNLPDGTWQAPTSTATVTSINATWDRVHIKDGTAYTNSSPRFGGVWLGW